MIIMLTLNDDDDDNDNDDNNLKSLFKSKEAFALLTLCVARLNISVSLQLR